MNYFFSAITKGDRLEAAFDAGVRKFLVSFGVPSTLEICLDVAKIPDARMMVDSGAFSAWQSKKVIDIQKYKEFILACPESFVFVNLDVIPQTGSSAITIRACVEKSVENFDTLVSTGRKIIPVYHYGEGLDVLDFWASRTDWVGFSPANDTSMKEKNCFLSRCFGRVRGKVRAHGFGYSAHFDEFPFYSVDSTSWLNPSLYGQHFSFEQGRLRRISHNVPSVNRFLTPKQQLKKSMDEFLKLEDYITNLWKLRGVVWNEG